MLMTVLVVSMVLVVISFPLMMAIGGPINLFRITNASGKDIAVTSGHTQKTVRLLNQKAVIIPHSAGDIIVTLPDGKASVYRNVSISDLDGTPFVVKKRHIFFGYQDGYVFRYSLTVNLVLHKDGRLYVVPPDAKDVDVQKLEQPEGFPIRPDEAKGTEKASERSSDDEKSSRKRAG